MSPEHESSYYEIALTNRQVLTIFVVLLTCLVAAFLSGVWIGRNDGGQGPVQAAAAEPPVEQAQTQMTELNFFSEGSDREGAGEAKARPPAPPAAEPSPKAPPKAAADKKVEAKQTAAPQPAPVKPAPTKTAPAAATAGGRVIQVFSTLDVTQADKLVRRLGDGGYPAFLVEESLGGRTTYRVRVGPYEQQARAEKVADELRREYRLETWITSQAG